MTKTTAERLIPTEGSTQLPELALIHHQRTLGKPMQEWLRRRQVPPVLLLTGQSGIGKRSIASFLAQWILCEKSGFSSSPGTDPSIPLLAPCGECNSCRKVRMGNEVDLIEITSDTNEDSSQNSGTLKIDQFRKLKSTTGFGAHEGQFKIILIPDADRMTLQASNSVLKLLEETPTGWIFILTAADPTLLLPTIVSRCQILRLKPFSQDQLQDLLKNAGVETERRKICALLGEGSWNRALAFSGSEVWEQRRQIFQFMKDPGSTFQNLMDWASQDPSHLELLIDILEQFSADLLRWSTYSEPKRTSQYSWTNKDGKESLLFHAERIIKNTGGLRSARAFWLARSGELAQARQHLSAPINRKILIQSLLMSWMRAHS